MIREELTRNAVHQLIRGQQLGVLSTAGEKGPYASLVAFSISDDDRRLFFVTPRTTRKFANITADARVALLVNNSINRPEDFHQAAAVTAVGRALTIVPPELESVRDHYLAKHPYLKEFAYSPSCAFVAIRVERYILVERFQNVTEYRIEDELDSTH
ncbi:pyridoxamine 5'-phosphate oxidase family protein [uncultured Desulfosarcina sp.]|uniref:pyridoxamine 5'-phosphate oxidase family protein n=1 Tax=uncultured Desulfosarcina sp. TaxID=218289 RepID=UPI0029C8C178|nr:pyridoxamine 5'-phosphate oxidase family protein [uncultured Desulfosarcina sp.]